MFVLKKDKKWRMIMNIMNVYYIIILKVPLFLNWFLGKFDTFLYALIVFLIVNYIIDIIIAILDKKLFMKIVILDQLKKLLIFIFIGLAHIIDLYIIIDSNSIRNAVVFFYLSNEGISLLKKAKEIGLPVPQKLKQILNQLKNSK